MSAFSNYRASLLFVGGFCVGLVASLAALRLGGFSLVSQQDLDDQHQLITNLQEENYELTNDLFVYRGPDTDLDASDLPYSNDVDASVALGRAKQSARDDHKYLMVVFGANWCVDCRTLHRLLQSPEVRLYADDTIDVVNVSVGKFNTNLELAADLGVDLRRGIPVAVFFNPDGKVIGTTNDGQLEPARYYTSKQILKFVRDIVEKSLIAAPDSVR